MRHRLRLVDQCRGAQYRGAVVAVLAEHNGLLCKPPALSQAVG